MGGYEPNNYDDVSNYLNFPNDSDDEDIANTPRPRETESKDRTMSTPLSPPASSADDDAIEDDQDEDDLYGSSNYNDWKARRNSNAASLDSPVNPQWLSSDQPPRHSGSLSVSDHHNPTTPTSDDAKSPGDRRTALQTIQEKNELLIKTQVTAKTSKSFPLLPDLLSLKQAEDEDEKILASEEGKRLNPRERRQLRNKVSARNFRVRRKEYIGHLENLVESQNQEIETLRQSLNNVQLENTQLRQESGFLRSIALNQQPQASTQPQNDPVLPVSHPNKDVNPSNFDWPLAYDGSTSPTSANNNKFADRNMFGGGGHNIHAYGVRVPDVQFDKPHLQNSAPPLPPPPTPQYSPASPRSSQEAPKTPPGMPSLPPGVESGYPGMLQAVSYLYDYIVKASSGNPVAIPQPQQQPMMGYQVPQPYHQPQQWGDAKMMGAPALGFNPYANGNWGWGGGPPGPTA